MNESLYCKTCKHIYHSCIRWRGSVTTMLSRIVTWLSIVVLIGMLPWLSGNDPALALLRARSGDQEATAETLNAIRHSLHLDQGPVHFILQWLQHLVHGDAGNSWISGMPVLPGLLRATGVSLTLMSAAACVAFVLAFLICIPVIRRGLSGKPKRSSGILAAIFTSVPEFLLGAFFLITCSVWLGWFPPYGWVGFHSMVLPALSLGLPAGGYLGRIISDGLAATFTENWLITWRMARISKWHITVAVVKRTLPALLPLVGLVLVSLTGGAISVEKIYAIPGLGRTTLGAASSQDLPTLQTGVLILLVLAAIAGMTANILREWLQGAALKAGNMPVPEVVQLAPSNKAYILPVSCIALLLLLLVFGLPRDPFTSLFLRLESPSLSLPFGADAMGRDLLARVAHGTLNTCVMALAVTLICLVAGMFIGMFPKLFAGPIEVANALPAVIAGLLVAALYGPSMLGASIAVILVSWAPIAAHTAGLVTEIRSRPYIRMLPILGVGSIRTHVLYVFPVLIGPLFRHAMLRLPGIALALASLGFLGLGAPPPTPEWGRILAEGMPYVERAWWVVFAPAAALAILSVLAVSSANLPKWHLRQKEHAIVDIKE